MDGGPGVRRALRQAAMRLGSQSVRSGVAAGARLRVPAGPQTAPLPDGPRGRGRRAGRRSWPRTPRRSATRRVQPRQGSRRVRGAASEDGCGSSTGEAMGSRMRDVTLNRTSLQQQCCTSRATRIRDGGVAGAARWSIGFPRDRRPARMLGNPGRLRRTGESSEMRWIDPSSCGIRSAGLTSRERRGGPQAAHHEQPAAAGGLGGGRGDAPTAGASAHRRFFGGAFEDQRVGDARECRANHRGQPEQPQLLNRPAPDEERRGRAACRVHRRVRHRNADQMDQREREADGESCKPHRGALVRGVEDDQQEHERHHDFGDQPRRQRIAAGRVRAVAIGRKPSGQAEVRLATRDEVQHAGAETPPTTCATM